MLAVRTIAKQDCWQTQITLHPKFRQIIFNIAQANHHLSTTMQRRIYGRRITIEIRPLKDDKAVEAAAALLGELFIFSVAGAAVIYEVQRNSRAEARKEEKRKQELETIRQSNNNLAKEVDHLKHKLEELSDRSTFSMSKFLHSQSYEAQNSGKI